MTAESDSAATRAPSSPRSRAGFDRALAAACLLCIALSAGLVCTFGYGRDQGIYAMVADSILDGGMPYRDAFDFKPPGIFLVYALSRGLFGESQHAVRFVEAAGLIATVWGMTWLSRRHFGSTLPGLVGGALYALTHAQLDFWHTGQPESFGGMLSVGALCAASHAHRATRARDQALGWIVSGVLFGAAGLMKPPLAGGGALVAAWAAWDGRRAGARGVLSPLGWTALGGVAPFVLVLAWFASRGALGELHEVLFVFTPHYTKLSWVDQSTSLMVWRGIRELFFEYSSLVTAGLCLLPFSRPSREGRALLISLASVVAVQIVGVILQGKFFPYHLGGVWPIAGLAAGFGYVAVWRRAVSRGWPWVAAFAAGVVVLAPLQTATKHVARSFWERSGMRARLFVLGRGEVAEIDGLATVADVHAGANRAVATYLRDHVAPDAPVFVWGFEPVIYDLSDRRPASRFIYNVPQRVSWNAGPLRAALIGDLTRTPPQAIVVEHGDVFPFVTGNALDSAQALYDFPDLAWLLAERYRPAARIQDFDIYLRVGRDPDGGAGGGDAGGTARP